MRLAGGAFSGVFSTKIQRTNTLKLEYAIEMNFFSLKWIWGVKIRVNLLMFTAGRQTTGFHVLDSMWTSRACAVAFEISSSKKVNFSPLYYFREFRHEFFFLN